MENDLFWTCKCGYENRTAASAFRHHAAPTHECAGCHDRTPITRAECYTVRRTPAVEEVMPAGAVCDCSSGPKVHDPGCAATAHDSGATVNATFPTETRGDYATAPVYKCNSKECGALSLESGLVEGLCACGASVTEVRDVSKDQYRRMCAQADEIGALKGRLAETAGALDTYRARCAELLRERDEARAEVERLKREVHELKIKCQQQRRDCVEFAGELRVAEEDERVARDENTALRARIAALEAVIEAQTAYNTAALNLRDAWDAAGLNASVVEKARITEEP